MVRFDAAGAGTSAETWDADPRMHDRPVLSLDGVEQLLVVAAHPDDETLGAGALIAECSSRGIPATIVMVTDGAAFGEPVVAQRRAAELDAAADVLGASVVSLGFPDGATREHAEGLRSALAPLISGTPSRALIAAPWRGDGHRDHRVVGELVADLVGGRTLVEYPIWMWHWADPAGPEVPWERMVAVRAGGAKRKAISQYVSQMEGPTPMLRADFLANFERDWELLIRSPNSLGADYFDATYERNDDPWGFESRWYEQRKRALTMAILPDDHYATALEIGCSIGVLTESLVDRVEDLLAVDVSRAAVERARARLGGRVRVEQLDVMSDFPAGSFELIVLSEVGYYFGAELDAVLDAIEAGLTENGTLVACHWRHPVADYPLSGDEVHERLRARGFAVLASHLEEDFVLEVFSSDGRSVARRTGLL